MMNTEDLGSLKGSTAGHGAKSGQPIVKENSISWNSVIVSAQSCSIQGLKNAQTFSKRDGKKIIKLSSCAASRMMSGRSLSRFNFGYAGYEHIYWADGRSGQMVAVG